MNGWQVEVAPKGHDTGGIYESYGRGWLIQIPDEKENILKEEIHERQVKLDMLDGIKQELKTIENFSIESIGDIAYAMENKKKMSGARI